MADSLDAFERGRQMFRDGVFRPRNVWSDEEWLSPCSDGQCEWLGWTFERATKLMREDKNKRLHDDLRDWAERGGPLPPEFLR